MIIDSHGHYTTTPPGVGAWRDAQIANVVADPTFVGERGVVLEHVWFDTCVYHQPGIDLLFEVVPTSNILFASEMVGAVRGIDAETGHYFDDTKRYVDEADLTDAERAMVYEGNVLRVFPRLAGWIESASSKAQQR